MKISPIINYNALNIIKTTESQKHKIKLVSPSDIVSFGRSEESKELTLSQIKALNTMSNKFPEDISYRKALAAGLGLKPSEHYLIQSIIGPSEFKNAILNFKEINYTPGKRKHPEIIDSHDLSNVTAGKYRASLHNHSEHSDGKLTIKEMLEEAVTIANNNKKKSGIITKVKNAPFILGITDHDTIEGTKEALKIIKENPWKYKNLKIVLGLEITAIGNSFRNQEEPISIHTLFYNLNPFDKELNDFLDAKKEGKKQLVNETIQNLNSANLFKSGDVNIEFSLDELNQVYKMPQKGLGEIYNALVRYAEAKLIFEYLTTYDQAFMNTLSRLGFEPEDFELKNIIDFQKSQKIQTGSFIQFEQAFGEYINLKLAERSSKYNRNFVPIKSPSLCKELEQALKKTREICKKAQPKLKNLNDAYADFDETLRFLSQQEYGEICTAHPAKLSFKNTKSTIGDFYREFYKVFKNKGLDKAVYNEEYYQSYDMEKSAPAYLISKYAAEEEKLLPTGGTDSHGDNIWSRRKLKY